MKDGKKEKRQNTEIFEEVRKSNGISTIVCAGQFGRTV